MTISPSLERKRSKDLTEDRLKPSRAAFALIVSKRSGDPRRDAQVLIAVCRKVCHGRFDTKLMAGESLGIVQGISRANLVLNSREIYQ